MANGSKSIPILLAMVIAVAQLLCSCQTVLANWVPAPKPAAHACCEKDSAPATPVPHDCPHCDGTATTAGVIEQHQAALPAFDIAFIATPSLAILKIVDQLSARWIRSELTISPPTSTLLGLHCAQNC